MTELRGKFLYDMVSAQVAGQVADMSALSGRAKDLIGTATISTTVSGAIANDKLISTGKHEVAKPFVVLLVLGFGLVLTAGFVALKPRAWSFVPDAGQVLQAGLVANPQGLVDDYYTQVAMGFITAGTPYPGVTAIERNARQIKTLQRCVKAQLAGVTFLAIAGVLLAARSV